MATYASILNWLDVCKMFALITHHCSLHPPGMMSTPSSFSTVRPWEGRALPTVSHRALRRSCRPWRGRSGASWSGSSLVWRRSRGRTHVDQSLAELTNQHNWAFGLILLSQDASEGIWTATRPARPARCPHGRPVGVRNFLQPSWWGRSVSWGQAVAATQRPSGGPHAHTRGTQQTAGVSAPSPPTAIAPGNTFVGFRSRRCKQCS